ncbi:hypothetical protein DBV39_18470 [Orrella marina]|uniref:Uncharacterized protein n=1 Tax=Orrella marina TaxID=2163011 RepID=A0A2R4XNQ4_9BURK|nr:hypothetical protein DBV39_18470 [Orrella marina]
MISGGPARLQAVTLVRKAPSTSRQGTRTDQCESKKTAWCNPGGLTGPSDRMVAQAVVMAQILR